MVVRGDAVGGAEPGAPPAVRAARRPGCHRELRRVLPRRRLALLPCAAGELPEGDLRPDARVLAGGRRRAPHLQGDAHVPAAQEHRIHAQPAVNRRPGDCMMVAVVRGGSR